MMEEAGMDEKDKKPTHDLPPTQSGRTNKTVAQ